MMAADYRHIGGVENRLGRHYSRFSPFSPTPALADQSLAWRKLWNAGSNRRSRAKTGDAWLLDPADRLAARLARDGESEPIPIEETDTTFAIGWKGSYRIDGPAFVYSDHDTSRVTTILGYPTDKLGQTG